MMKEYSDKYPYQPMIRRRNDKQNPKGHIEIDYNGIRIYVKPKPSQTTYEINFSKLEQTLDNEIKEKTIEPSAGHQQVLRNYNLRNEQSRDALLNILQKYARWFSNDKLDILDDLIVKYVVNDYLSQPITAGSAESPNKAFLEAQRKRDREYFRDMLKATTHPDYIPDSWKK